MAADPQGGSEVAMERRASGASPSVTSPPTSTKSGSRSHFNTFASLKRGKYLGGLFSLDEFVQLRPSCGLTKLSTDLHELFITIGQALESEINANAEAMIGSGFKLDGCGNSIIQARDILTRSIQEVESFYNFIDTEQTAFEKQLANQAELREKKLMIRATTLISKMERLVGIANSDAESTPESGRTIDDTQ